MWKPCMWMCQLVGLHHPSHRHPRVNLGGCKPALATCYPSLEPVDSSTLAFCNPESRRALLRHSSVVRAVCVNAHVRICAGCALKAHGVQFPEMETAAKPSSQPRTKSCVMSATVSSRMMVSRFGIRRDSGMHEFGTKQCIFWVIDELGSCGQ
jgi:hypothetical protein